MDDSTPALRPRNREAVERLREAWPGGHVEYLENARPPGASGAWNTGLRHLAAREDPGRLFVAILDDDDFWDARHLELCAEAAARHGLDMVAAGLVRHEMADPAQPGRPQSIPDRLCAGDFLTGNPHVQGSNLFVRLQKLLEAGLFDEGLASTTDRDLCIRLADLGDVRFGALSHHTVHHFAERERDRLSSRGAPAKQAGLEAFWSKYRGRMSDAQRDAFLSRGRELFGWEPRQLPPASRKPSQVPSEAAITGEGELAFLVGITVDATAPARVEPLLRDLLDFSRSPEVAGLDVLLLENGPRPPGERPLDRLVQGLWADGLRCFVIPLEQQRRDAARGIFGEPFHRGDERLEIARARTLLQRYLYSFAHPRPGAVIWILDDDKRLDALVAAADGRIRRERRPIVPALLRLRQQGVHAVLGEDTGAAPLPPATTLRGQLVDLHANLQWLGRLPPDAPLPDRSAENARARRLHRDPYYDLSREGGALETPFWLIPEHTAETAREALQRIASRLPRLLVGEPLFRPLVHDLEAAIDPAATVVDSVRRGGSMFVLDLEALSATPNAAAVLEGRLTRRSDMIWSLINVHACGRRLVRAPLPVRHDRGDLLPRPLDLESLADDLRGSALYLSLEELLRERAARLPLTEVLRFDEAGLDRLAEAFGRHLRARADALMAGLARMRGALRSVRALLDEQKSPWAFWHADADGRRTRAMLETALAQLDAELLPERWTALARRLQAASLTDVRAFAAGLEATVESFRQASRRSDGMLDWPTEQRIQIARAQLERLCDLPPDARLLGVGYEGVVFTDGRSVFKCFDGWKARASPEHRRFLRGLVGRWHDTRVLYPLQALREEGIHAALVYPYEPSQPYEGGHADGLVQLLRETRTHGLAFRNITAENLRVTEGGLRLIDYGSDLVPYSEEELEQMARRAFLSWRWPHRPDLKKLLSRSLRDGAMPELSGVERLLAAVRAPLDTSSLDALLEGEVLRTTPTRVLDYGCGPGRLAGRLATRGLRVLGFDPDTRLMERWPPRKAAEAAPDFTCQRGRLEAEAPFDVVVCALVLCTLEDGPAYEGVLRDLRARVRGDGQVLLAVCNPFFTLGGDTPLQRRHVPPGAAPEDTFVWEKEVALTCARRRDVHRPLSRLRRDLLRAGLAIDAISWTETVDLQRMEPSSDFLVLRLRPVPLDGPRISLMIKTCAMEWATLEPQVQHLVRQLEGPRAFIERVLVVDGRKESFPRAHAQADEAEHAQAAERLLREGWVDRILRGPHEPSEVAALNARWFGVTSTATHAANGSQVASTLAGFEACAGEYVLQVDSDVMIGRRAPAHDFLGEAVQALERDPHGLTVSLDIFHGGSRPFTTAGRHGPWRVEVRAALFHRERLLSLRPLPNEVDGSVLAHPWYRAADERLRQGPWRSYRGGGGTAFFIHPPNDRKREADIWMALLDRVEDGWIPPVQEGSVDLVGPLEGWLGPPRREHFVFVVQGRNVPPGRLLRCLESMRAQQRDDWGAVVIDDASSPARAEFLTLALAPLRDRVTLLRMRLRRGKLPGFVWAIRHVVADPESILIDLDADDALLGTTVLDRLAAAYDRGADLTVGSMLRTDKHREYPVDFEDPRARRGGNVWQHPRTFKKRLFDSLPDEYLRLDGQYVDLASDWAVMLPLVELAAHPVSIPEPLYLYEPSGVGKGAEREAREAIIARLVARPSLKRRE